MMKPLIGFLTLTSRPTAATVIIDSLEIGKTPFRGRLPIGPHKLELKKENYLSHFETFTINEGKTQVLNIALKEIPSKDITPKLGLTEKSPKSKSKKWLYIGGGAAVLAGAAAVLILSGNGGSEQSPPQSQSLPEPPAFP